MRISLLAAIVICGLGTSAFAADEHRHPWSLTYQCGMQTAIIQESGATTVTRVSPGTWYKGKVGQSKGKLDKADTARLFKLVASPEFAAAQPKYLPRPGTFEAHGHSLITTMTLLDKRQRLVKMIVFSDKAQHPVPDVLKQISSIASVGLVKLFGPPPPMIIN